MTTVTTTLLTKLTEGSTSFKFRKADGTIREANGTLNNDLIPEAKRSSVTPTAESAVIAYYDLGSNDWRSFRADAIVA